MKKRVPNYGYSPAVLANEVGMTTEGLRYYEKKGIGRYLRKENGYRACHPQEAAIIRFARCLNSFGFSVKESIGIITQGMDLPDLLCAMEEKRSDLLNSIRKSQSILGRMEDQIHAISNLAEGISRIWFENRDAFYYLDYGTGLTLHEDEKLNTIMHRWMEIMPIATPMPRLILESTQENEDPDIYGGFSILEKDLPDESYLNDQYCRFYPARNYLCTISLQNRANGLTIREPQIQNAFHLMQSMNLRLDGDCFFQTVLANEYDDGIKIYYKVYIPVAPVRN